MSRQKGMSKNKAAEQKVPALMNGGSAKIVSVLLLPSGQRRFWSFGILVNTRSF